LELFVITFIKDKMTLRVPTAKIASVGMRKLAEPPLVRRALETLKGRARIKRTMWSRRAQEYEAKINSGDIVAIAEVVRDLFRSDTQPEQSYSVRQLYEAALDRLSRETAAVQKVTETEAIKEIEAALAKGPRRGPKPAEGESEGEEEETGGEEEAGEAVSLRTHEIQETRRKRRVFCFSGASARPRRRAGNPFPDQSGSTGKMPRLSAPIRNYGDIFLAATGRETIGFCAELGKQVVKIAAREGPFEGPCGFLVALLEPDQMAFESGKRGEVVGIEKLALDD